MKKLQTHIILFLLPVLLLIIVIPVDKKLKYLGLREDCFHHALVHYDRLFVRDKPIDVLIMGTSRSINGVDDKLIEERFSKDSLDVYNLAYCRPGRNLHYALLKDALISHQPSHLIIEVSENESPYTHPVFPQLAETRDVLLAEPIINKDWLSDLFNHGAYKVVLWQDALYGLEPPPTWEDTDYGHAVLPDTADRQQLIEILRKKIADTASKNTSSSWFYNHFPLTYQKEIAKLCSENNIQIHYLYLRSFGVQRSLPGEFESYQQWGNLLLPPHEIFENPDYWYDREHLNRVGATALSEWLVSALRESLHDQ